MYPMQRQAHERRFRNQLSSEECDIVEALKDYTTNSGIATSQDFVPLFILYDLYKRTHFSFSHLDEAVLLTPQQFGCAVRRVFPRLESNRVRRTYNGRREWGYIGLKGPASVRVNEGPGRPRPTAAAAA
jgi:hypothetical protein